MGRPGNCPSTGHSQKNLHHRTPRPRFSSRIQRARRRLADRIRYCRQRLRRQPTASLSRPTISTSTTPTMRSALDEQTIQAYKVLRSMNVTPLQMQMGKGVLEQYRAKGVSAKDLLEVMQKHGEDERGMNLAPMAAAVDSYEPGMVLDEHLTEANDTNYKTKGMMPGWAKAAAYILVPAGVGAVLLGGAAKAEASPIMSVDDNYGTFGEHDASHPGFERIFTYDFGNESDTGDVNNMIAAMISNDNGLDMGIYKVVFEPYMDDFNANITNPDKVIMDGGVLPPDKMFDTLNRGRVSLYTGFEGIGQGTASATGRGPPDNQPFNDVQVDVPIPEPTTLAVLAAGAVGALLRKRRNDLYERRD